MMCNDSDMWSVCKSMLDCATVFHIETAIEKYTLNISVWSTSSSVWHGNLPRTFLKALCRIFACQMNYWHLASNPLASEPAITRSNKSSKFNDEYAYNLVHTISDSYKRVFQNKWKDKTDSQNPAFYRRASSAGHHLVAHSLSVSQMKERSSSDTYNGFIEQESMEVIFQYKWIYWENGFTESNVALQMLDQKVTTQWPTPHLWARQLEGLLHLQLHQPGRFQSLWKYLVDIHQQRWYEWRFSMKYLSVTL